MKKSNDLLLNFVLILLIYLIARYNGPLHCIMWGLTHLLQAQNSHLFLFPGRLGAYPKVNDMRLAQVSMLGR